MEANIQKLEKLTTAELVILYRFYKDRWSFIQSKIGKERTEYDCAIVEKYQVVGYLIEKLLDTRLDELIITETV